MSRALMVVITLLVAVGCAGNGATEEADAPRPFETVRPGDPLPAAELERLGAEGTVDTSGWRGKPTVVNFWATWCPPCVEEMPAFESAHQQLGDRVRFIGVDVEDPNVEAALSLAEETGVTYPLVRDPDRSYFQAVRGRGMPLTVFVDGDGTIQYRHNGPLSEARLLELVDEHLDP